VRQESTGRVMRYTTHVYATDKAPGKRY